VESPPNLVWHKSKHPALKSVPIPWMESDLLMLSLHKLSAECDWLVCPRVKIAAVFGLSFGRSFSQSRPPVSER
jgi:hypothetical protein